MTNPRPAILAVGGAERTHGVFPSKIRLYGWLFNARDNYGDFYRIADFISPSPESSFFGYTASELFEIAQRKSEFADNDGKMIQP